MIKTYTLKWNVRHKISFNFEHFVELIFQFLVNFFVDSMQIIFNLCRRKEEEDIVL